MELTLYREKSTTQSTSGELHIDGKLFLYTLEDITRDIKIPGQTAIPFGRYKVILNNSQRFQKRMPLLLDVPGFEGVRIHSGNTAADTEGCILVGMKPGIDCISNSRDAFMALMNKLENQNIIYINIVQK